MPKSTIPAAGGALPASGRNPDAALFALLEKWRRLKPKLDAADRAMNEAERRQGLVYRSAIGLRREIAETPAATREGALAKVGEFLPLFLGENIAPQEAEGDTADAILRSAARDLASMETSA